MPYRFTVKVDGLALEPSEKLSWTTPRVAVGALFSDCPPAVRLLVLFLLQVADHNVCTDWSLAVGVFKDLSRLSA